ncbi:MAG: J domain-containing protein [Chitinophagaceae bacterium]|nr:J domain-containing protein [Chitinophagaceae bacterium]
MTTHQDLLTRFENLRLEYIALLNEKDVLLQWGKPQLLALYATRIGTFQVNLLQLQLRVKALKRKLEMVRGSLARQEKPDLIAIELAVAAELAEAEQTIMRETAAIESGKDLLNHLVSNEDSAALRQVFKAMAKRLHPDVNPQLTEAQQQLWQLAKEAYETCDLEKLKALSVVFEEALRDAEHTPKTWSSAVLEERIGFLEAGIRRLKDELMAIRQQFPFDLESQIHDTAWVEQQTKEIEEAIQALQHIEQELLQEYQQLTSQIP